MKFKKFLAVCTTALLAFGLAGLGAVSASADALPKVVVCKYVQTPGANEQLDHIIIPNANSLTWFTGTFPAAFSDAQGKSVAIRYATEGEQAKDVALTECPAPTPPPVPKVATPTQPSASAGIEVCVDGKSVNANGTIVLPAFDHGHWAEASGTLTNITPGEYAFTAVADDGFTLTLHDVDGLMTDLWFVTVPASVDVDCGVVPPADPTYITAVWQMPSWINSTTPTWSQSLVSSTPQTTVTLDVAVPTTCGTQYQVDAYNDNSVTASLLSGGVLNGPNSPNESFPSPSGWNITYKLVKNPDCEIPPVLTPVTPIAPTWTDLCGVDNGSWGYTNTDEYTYKVTSYSTGKVKIVVTPNAGFTFPEGTTVQWQKYQNNDLCPVPPTLVQCDGVADGGVSTNLAPNGWTTNGDVEWVNGGIKLSVPGGWATASISRVFNQTIEHVGSAIGFTASPGQYVGIHLRTSEGSITFEQAPGYGDNWWSEADFGVGAGMGYASFASLADYVAQNPDLVVNSIDVLYTHPEASSTVLTDVTFGCAKYTFDFQPVVVETVPAVTFSDVCGVANDAIVGGTDTSLIDYTITDSRVAGVGLVTVTAAAQPGYAFADGAYTGPWSQEFTNVNCGEVEIAYIAPSAFDPTCPGVEDGASGYLQLDLKDHLHYAIDGVSTTQARNELAPGTYTVSVTVDPGFTLSGPASWEMTINPPFCPPTLALLSTTASMSNITCTTSGTYTLANTEGIKWLVNGVLTPAGTHTVADATTLNVEAQLVDDVTDGWEEGAQKTWTFDFTDPAACDLTTLAFTGSDGGNLGLLLAGGFLLFGGTIVAFERRFRTNAR